MNKNMGDSIEGRVGVGRWEALKVWGFRKKAPCYSKYGQQCCNTWEPVRNAVSQAPPQNRWAHMCVSKLPSWHVCTWKWEKCWPHQELWAESGPPAFTSGSAINGCVLWGRLINPFTLLFLFCKVGIQKSLLPSRGICSRTSSGCLMPWLVLNPTDTFSCMYIPMKVQFMLGIVRD